MEITRLGREFTENVMYEQGQVDIFPASLIPKNLHGLMEPIWSLHGGRVGRARLKKADYGDKQGVRMSTEPGVLFSVLKYVPDEEVLGRLASRVAVVLMGKDKPTYTPNQDNGDVCIVLNARSIGLTGNKLTDKVYRWHTGYIGHLKERTVKEQMARKPEEVIRKAVLRMLPRNKLQDDRARKLRIFPDDVHPFADKQLSPYVMPPRKIREFRPRERRLMSRSPKKSSET